MASMYASWIKLMCSQFKCTVPLCWGRGLSPLSLGLARKFGSLFTATNARESSSAPPVDCYIGRFTQLQQRLLSRGVGTTNLGLCCSQRPVLDCHGSSTGYWELSTLHRWEHVKLLKLLNAPNSVNIGQ